MRLERLLQGLGAEEFEGDPGLEITGLAYDSRRVRPGHLFVALKGHLLDGRRFIRSAVENGAVAVVSDETEGIPPGAARIRVPDPRAALSRLAVTFYHAPFEGMTLTAVTGTNGKTTTSYLLEAILSAAGRRAGVIGTIGYRMPGKALPAPVTTPESLDLMRILREMADAGVTDGVLEVSSHALAQGRVRDCPFRVAVFTNLTRDHLDYHGTMDAYFEAKSRLFLGSGGAGRPQQAVINGDDPWGRKLAKRAECPVWTYGLSPDRDVRAADIRMSMRGLSAILATPAGQMTVKSALMGDFNIYNILAATAAALCLDIAPESIVSGIGNLGGVPGRLERVENARSLPIIVDYAHTPDALQKALSALRPLVKGRLVTVFGCGGDRDTGKRREMGRVAGEHSDLVFVTSDNPRSEAPARIAEQIASGLNDCGWRRIGFPEKGTFRRAEYVVELDRARAIRMAVEAARKGDLVLIAGKGHEDYQIIGNHRRHFDDREVAAAAASGEGGAGAGVG